MVDDRRILPWWRKTPFTTVGQIKNTLQEVGVCVSKSQSREDFTRVNTEGSPQDVTIGEPQNRKARLEFAKRHLKKPSQFWNNILWTDEIKINLYQSDGKRRVWRRKGTAHDPNVMQWQWPESDWACISLAEDKTEGKMPQEQAGTEDGCSRGLAEHHQGRNPASGDVYVFQTSDCNWLQRICNQVLKSEFDLWLLFCPITFGPLTSGRHICKLL